MLPLDTTTTPAGYRVLVRNLRLVHVRRRFPPWVRPADDVRATLAVAPLPRLLVASGCEPQGPPKFGDGYEYLLPRLFGFCRVHLCQKGTCPKWGSVALIRGGSPTILIGFCF